MPLDVAPIGKLVAALMEVWEASEGEPELGAFALVAEVNWPEGEDGDPGTTQIVYRCSDPRRWIQEALFNAGARAVRASDRHPGEE